MITRLYVHKYELELISQTLGNQDLCCGQRKEVALEIACTLLGRRFDFIEGDLFEVLFDVY
jgi:hypothetical protein